MNLPEPDDLPEGWPYGPGTFVRCISWDGIVLYRPCRDHVFRIVTGYQEVDYGLGLAQAAQCLACEKTSPMVDAGWWWHRASDEDVEDCLRLMDKEIVRLRDGCKRICDLVGWDHMGRRAG